MTLRHCSRLFPLALALGCTLGGPVQAGMFSVSPDKERKLGDEAAREIDAQARIVTGPVADWVSSVGERLAAVSNPEFKYSFKVVEGKEINAFALPGGHVYVFTGLRKVAQTDDELAGILAHEITHAENHHYARQSSKDGKRGLLLGVLSAVAGLPNLAQQALSMANLATSLKYSRTSETEADLAGMERMARAGFDPKGMVSVLERLAKEDQGGGTLDNWFGDHPDADRRIQRAKNQLVTMSKTASAASLAQPVSQPTSQATSQSAAQPASPTGALRYAAPGSASKP